MQIKKKCLIIDNSKKVFPELEEALNSIFCVITEQEQSIQNGLVRLKNDKIDLILFYLNNIADLQLLNLFYPKSPPVIVISPCEDYALPSYNFEIVKGYLKEPLQKTDIEKVIKKIFSIKELKSGFIEEAFGYFKIGYKMVRVNLEEIDYVQGYGAYSKIYIKKKVLIVTQSIYEMEESLPSTFFKRIHRSYIINLYHIEEITTKNCHISGKDIPIGNKYKELLHSIIKSFNGIIGL